jgi:predicted Fe-Mo cluster-binding NifX family protein
MRVAVASSDGIVVNQHFGRADMFYIFELNAKDGVRYIEKRRGRPFCHGGEHEDGELKDAVELLCDCQKVFVLQIGAGAQRQLVESGIEPVVARGIIQDVLENEIVKRKAV